MVFLSFQFTYVIAHPGGHYHKGDGIVLNTWRLKSGKTIRGNFSFSRDNKIFLEQENGILQSVLIAELTSQDQQLANFKIKQYTHLNAVHVEPIFENNILFYLISFLIIFSFIILTLKKKSIYYISKMHVGFFVLLFSFLIMIACSKTAISTTSSTNTPTSPITLGVIPKTNTSFIDAAFSAFKPSISTNWDDNYFYITSSGIPNHNMMVGITNWQQQVPIPQPYNGTNSWSIPLQPVYATTPLSTKTNLMKGAVAIAVNGIPIFNALNNRGEDSYKIGELDNWGGHCGKGDDYHYHAAPLHLATTNGLQPIAFALDGFAIYGTKEPEGTSMFALDTCHGHMGTNGLYHYHGTTDYPYVIGALKGKVTIDPSTTAPENQIIPQAFTKPVRPATNPLNGASIVDFATVGTNGYLLTYKIGTKNGYVKYSWDANNKFTFILTDTGGMAITNTYQR